MNGSLDTGPSFGRGWRQTFKRAVIVFAILFTVVLRASNYQGVIVSAEGQVVRYWYSAWWLAIFTAPIAILLIVGIATITLRGIAARIVGVVILLLCAVVAVVVPTMCVAELIVAPERFTLTTGFWWKPVTQQVQFDLLDAISIEQTEARGESHDVVRFQYRDGKRVDLRKSPLLKVGLRRIVVYAATHDVTFESDRELQDQAAEAITE